MNRKIASIIIISLIVIFAFFGFKYIYYRTQNAVSNAAFIKSKHLSTLSFKVGGKVVKMLKEEGDSVKKGELLAIMDSKDFNQTKKSLIFKRDAIIKQIKALTIKKEQTQKILGFKKQIDNVTFKSVTPQIRALELKISAKEIELSKIKKDYDRYKNLLNQHLIAIGDFEKIKTKYLAVKKEVDAFKQNLELLKHQQTKASIPPKIDSAKLLTLKEIEANIEVLKAQKKAVEANIEAISNKISYTKIYAPFDGIIAKKFFDAPRVVGKGSPVYAIVDPKHLYCEVLLSEQKLHGVKVGAKAKVSVDATKRDYEGVVSKIAPTSASTFSLVPRDIASGEFTKLDQRFVVKIELKDIKELRAGMGATVAIKRE